MNSKLFIALALGLAAPASAATNLVLNGSFELPGGIVRNQLSTNYLPGWTYNNGAFDIYEDDSQDGLTAADGNHYVSFGHNGTVGGSISQTVATVAGHQYTLSFYTAEQQGSDDSQSFHVELTTAFGGYYDFYVGGLTSSFKLTSTNFNPDSPTTIKITDATLPGNGVSSNLALDRVGVFDMNEPTGGVPEPASWAMLLAGFGVTGLALRRRRDLATVAA